MARVAITEPGSVDAAALADLTGQLGYPAAADEIGARMARLAGDGQILLAAELDGEVAGIAVMQIDPILVLDKPVARLTVLVVAEWARRRGVGRALTLAVEEKARRSGCDRVLLESAVWRGEAHEFYRALGYENSALIFQKQL